MDGVQITICITGAAGQIAYSLIPLILTGQLFKEKLINLKLLDLPQMEPVLKGVEMEILDGAYPLLQSVQSGSDPRQMFKGADIIVFLGGYPRKPGMERKDLLQLNGNIFKEQGEALNDVGNPNVKCVVVANPANTNCNILATHANKYSRSAFTCLSRLDENRMYAQIAQFLKLPVNQIQGVVVWGNHSTTQYPSIEYVRVNGEPISQDQSEFYHVQLIKSVQNRGGQILQARKNSSVFSAANAIKDHIRDWYHGTGDQLHSMGVSSDDSYGIPKNLYCSFPVIMEGNFKYTIKQGLSISSFSQDKINITIQELLDEEKDAGLIR